MTSEAQPHMDATRFESKSDVGVRVAVGTRSLRRKKRKDDRERAATVSLLAPFFVEKVKKLDLHEL